MLLYFKVIETPLVVAVTESAMTTTTISIEETITMYPGKFSYDPDLSAGYSNIDQARFK